MTDRIPKNLQGASEELSGRTMNHFWQDRQIATDIKEYPDRYEILADLPGVTKENILVHYDAERLTISATQNFTENDTDDGHYLRRERATASFQRSFAIKNIVAEEITAKYENGVLRLSLPKQSPNLIVGKIIPVE